MRQNTKHDKRNCLNSSISQLVMLLLEDEEEAFLPADLVHDISQQECLENALKDFMIGENRLAKGLTSGKDPSLKRPDFRAVPKGTLSQAEMGPETDDQLI